MTQQEQDALLGKAGRELRDAQERLAILKYSWHTITEAWRGALPTLSNVDNGAFRVDACEIVVEKPDLSHRPLPGHKQRMITLATLKREHVDYDSMRELLREIEDTNETIKRLQAITQGVQQSVRTW